MKLDAVEDPYVKVVRELLKLLHDRRMTNRDWYAEDSRRYIKYQAERYRDLKAQSRETKHTQQRLEENQALLLDEAAVALGKFKDATNEVRTLKSRLAKLDTNLVSHWEYGKSVLSGNLDDSATSEDDSLSDDDYSSDSGYEPAPKRACPFITGYSDVTDDEDDYF